MLSCSAIQTRSLVFAQSLGIGQPGKGGRWLILHQLLWFVFFFSPFSLHLQNCFYLDPWVLSLLLFLFLPISHCGGGKRVAVCMLSCWPDLIPYTCLLRRGESLTFTRNFLSCEFRNMVVLWTIYCQTKFQVFYFNRYNTNITDGVMLWLSFTTVFYYCSTYL